MKRITRMVDIDVAEIRHKTVSGMSLTRDEQWWLVELTGDPLPMVEKRCYACNETGGRKFTGYVYNDALVRIPTYEGRECPDCGGHGRIQEHVVYRIANRQLLKVLGLPTSMVSIVEWTK